MRIWIDLANSPHVPFFRALRDEFAARGHETLATAREFAQTLELARAAGLGAEVVGGHGGRGLAGKAGNLLGRALDLRRWARGRGIDLAVSHNSYSQIVAARASGLRAVTLMDYEHQPANHLAFRLASRVVVPAAFPDEALRRFGASARKVRRYEGFKEDVYLADYSADARAVDALRRALGVADGDVLVVVRPPARDALYHRFENELFDALLERLSAAPRLRAVLLARTEAQRALFAARLGAQSGARPGVEAGARPEGDGAGEGDGGGKGDGAGRGDGEGGGNFILPRAALDGATLLSAADLVVSAGGTMNREAAALGVPAATIYAGRWAAVDEALVREGRLLRLRAPADIAALPLEKKRDATPRRATHVRARVADLILEELGER